MDYTLAMVDELTLICSVISKKCKKKKTHINVFLQLYQSAAFPVVDELRGDVPSHRRVALQRKEDLGAQLVLGANQFEVRDGGAQVAQLLRHALLHVLNYVKK